MAKLYYRDSKGRPRKKNPWTRSTTYKFLFWTLFLGNLTYLGYMYQSEIMIGQRWATEKLEGVFNGKR